VAIDEGKLTDLGGKLDRVRKTKNSRSLNTEARNNKNERKLLGTVYQASAKVE